MSKSSFRYETRQQLPATLTSEEREALVAMGRGARALVARGLAWLAAALNRRAETRRA